MKNLLMELSEAGEDLKREKEARERETRRKGFGRRGQINAK